MKRLLVLLTALSVLVVIALPATASAAGTPCRNKIFNDWYHDGKIASTYPLACYRDALRHIPPDAQVYSSLNDDIQAALRAAIRRSHGLTVPRVVGHGFAALNAGTVDGKPVPVSSTDPHDPVPGGTTVAAASPVTDSSSSVPIPLLVLGGLAIALAAAGAIGLGVRHVRARR